MTETEAAWLAGIVDGEGSVKVRRTYKNQRGEICNRNTPSWEIVVGMTHKPTVDRCREIAGVGSQIRREFKNRKKPCFFWGVYCSNAKEVGREILPYSVTKRDLLEEMVGEVTT